MLLFKDKHRPESNSRFSTCTEDNTLLPELAHEISSADGIKGDVCAIKTLSAHTIYRLYGLQTLCLGPVSFESA